MKMPEIYNHVAFMSRYIWQTVRVIPPSAFYDLSNILIMIEIPTLTPYTLYYVLAAYLVIYYASSLG